MIKLYKQSIFYGIHPKLCKHKQKHIHFILLELLQTLLDNYKNIIVEGIHLC